MPLEIERKFLIALPDLAAVSGMPGCRVRESRPEDGAQAPQNCRKRRGFLRLHEKGEDHETHPAGGRAGNLGGGIPGFLRRGGEGADEDPLQLSVRGPRRGDRRVSV